MNEWRLRGSGGEVLNGRVGAKQTETKSSVKVSLMTLCGGEAYDRLH